MGGIKQLSVVDLFVLTCGVTDRLDVLIMSVLLHKTDCSMCYWVVHKDHQKMLKYPMLKEKQMEELPADNSLNIFQYGEKWV